MTGNPAVKVSLITCDLKSMNRPNGHSVTYAKVYHNPVFFKILSQNHRDGSIWEGSYEIGW